MDDLFGVRNSTVVADMCRLPEQGGEEGRLPPAGDFLSPLERFRKRIAVANAFNTDFLVSVSSGAFLSPESDSAHHHRDSEFVGSESFRWMRDTEHVALQVATTTRHEGDSDANEGASESCVDALDGLGWHKIFVDTRSVLPSFLNFEIPKLRPRATYASRELWAHFRRYGTLLPVAHPLNMANSRTDWYRRLTRGGRPVVDALAELVVLDVIELSERGGRIRSENFER
mmetsp:Transcript_26557/g.56492  ORF Transcript_26557/g.56492 Transcript_26557/m.56492 type:complete len:229 (+) Transcript_26557:3-689(+)